MKTKLRPGWVLALLCTVLFFYGFYLGGVQLVISEVSREYGQNAAGMGGLVAAQHVAAVVLPVVLGALADRIGKKPVLCIFAAVFAVGCFLAGLSKNLGVYVIGAVCVGAGYSVCESVSSAVLSELDARRQDFVLNQIRSGQVLITCCEPDRLSDIGKRILIENGQVREDPTCI